ncbi:MAG: potassium/proton antiporter [Ignavibacteriae bacterium]|nr:MAG: potassium/proton antiporter [Ignavibacteriota bacterium]
MAIEYLLLIGSFLIILSIIISKFSDNLGVPALLLFLAIGMFAGSEGPGGIYFDDAPLAQSIGVVALIFILFSGGLGTDWIEVRPILWQAASLSVLGVFVTAITVGFFVSTVFHIPFLHGLLLGSIVSSTDASAVFSVLRSRHVSLRAHLRPLLELESGSNDPMAVFLTLGVIQLILIKDQSVISLVSLFFFQMIIGGLFGLGFGKAMVFLLNRLRLSYEGLYPVFSLAFVALTYSVTATIGGSGFLAVYIAGLMIGNSEFIQKKSQMRFFDGLAWLSQITMFLTLGLLVFPSHILQVLGVGLLVSGFLMVVARPISVFLSLMNANIRGKEKLFVSWVGLRGAVPIVLATFPLIANLPDAEWIFNVVFFIVLTSALLQGWSIPFSARLLGVAAPLIPKRQYPIEFAPVPGVDTELVDLIVPYQSAAAGKSIVELGMPDDSLIVLISRNENFIVPSGGTFLQEGDTVLVLVNKTNLPVVRSILSELKPANDREASASSSAPGS